MKSPPNPSGEKKSRSEWIGEYSQSHQHPVNRACHLVGIPLITASIPLALLILFFPGWWMVPVGMFSLGWILQFVGHAVEGKPPEFLKDWRFFLVGFSWWLSKVRGKKETP